MSAVLRTRGLAVGYRRRRQRRALLTDLDLTLQRGELTCLLGPNGSGKSTLLRTLAGMHEPLAGRVHLLDADVHAMAALDRARSLAVVLTDQIEAGLLRACDVVALGRHPHTGWTGRLTAADRDVVGWALAAAGARRLADRPMAELSDGERQRVLIARALAQQPALLALDEPVAYVDVPRRVELAELLRQLARDTGLAVLLTTHDLDLALRSADRLWLLEPGADGPGAMHVGAPEDLVLSGAVARAFAADDVRFDAERATFLPGRPAAGVARVHGQGAPAVWAARALERQGLRPARDGERADVEVAVLFQGGFGLEAADTWSEHADLASLVAALTELRPARRPGHAPGQSPGHALGQSHSQSPGPSPGQFPGQSPDQPPGASSPSSPVSPLQ